MPSHRTTLVQNHNVMSGLESTTVLGLDRSFLVLNVNAALLEFRAEVFSDQVPDAHILLLQDLGLLRVKVLELPAFQFCLQYSPLDFRALILDKRVLFDLVAS